MMTIMARAKEVRGALEKVAAGITEETVLGAEFTAMIACAKLLKDDPGACAASRDAATDGLDAIEEALKAAGAKAKKRVSKVRATG